MVQFENILQFKSCEELVAWYYENIEENERRYYHSIKGNYIAEIIQSVIPRRNTPSDEARLILMFNTAVSTLIMFRYWIAQANDNKQINRTSNSPSGACNIEESEKRDSKFDLLFSLSFDINPSAKCNTKSYLKPLITLMETDRNDDPNRSNIEKQLKQLQRKVKTLDSPIDKKKAAKNRDDTIRQRDHRLRECFSGFYNVLKSTVDETNKKIIEENNKFSVELKYAMELILHYHAISLLIKELEEENPNDEKFKELSEEFFFRCNIPIVFGVEKINLRENIELQCDFSKFMRKASCLIFAKAYELPYKNIQDMKFLDETNALENVCEKLNELINIEKFEKIKNSVMFKIPSYDIIQNLYHRGEFAKNLYENTLLSYENLDYFPADEDIPKYEDISDVITDTPLMPEYEVQVKNNKIELIYNNYTSNTLSDDCWEKVRLSKESVDNGQQYYIAETKDGLRIKIDNIGNLEGADDNNK